MQAPPAAAQLATEPSTTTDVTGNTVVTQPDGSSVTTAADGTVLKEVSPDGTTTVVDPATGNTTVTDTTGVKTTSDPAGKIIKKSKVPAPTPPKPLTTKPKPKPTPVTGTSSSSSVYNDNPSNLSTSSSDSWTPTKDEPEAVLLKVPQRDIQLTPGEFTLDDVQEASNGIWYGKYTDGVGNWYAATASAGLAGQVDAYTAIGAKLEAAIGAANPAAVSGLTDQLLNTMVTAATSMAESDLNTIKVDLSKQIAKLQAACSLSVDDATATRCKDKLSKLQTAYSSLQQSGTALTAAQSAGSRRRRRGKKHRSSSAKHRR